MPYKIIRYFTILPLLFFNISVHAGDPEKGAKVYKKCIACHMIGENAKNRIGPELNNIIGRKIAGIEGFSYSKAMQAFAIDNPVWTEELLGEYLKKPAALIKGTRMSFVGLRKQKDVDNVIAYLKAQ